MTQRAVVLSMSVLFTLAAMAAEDPNEAKARFAQAQKQNAAQLRQYGWTSRTELKLKGESKSIKTESVRYDANGQLKKTTIDSSPQNSPQGGGRAKQKVIEKKKTEFTALLGGLAKLAQSYAHLTPEQARAFAQGAAISKVEGLPEDTVQLQGANAVVKGDIVTLWVDGSTFLMRRVGIDTVYEKNPVKLTVTYDMLPEGPVHPARVALSYPEKEVEVTVENSNYQRLETEAIPGSTAVTPPADQGWPRQIVKDGTTLVTYQPQVDEWSDFKTLHWRMAVSVTPKGGKAALGALRLQALTDVDHDTHAVVIHDLKIQNASFPSLETEAAARMGDLVRSFLPPTVTISLERIVACTPKKDSVQTVELKNDPPNIFFSYKPAILLEVEGEPVNVPIQNTNLEYMMNTAWRLFRDKTDSHYYFLAGEQWLTATALTGPWSPATALPKDMETAAQDEHFVDLKEFVPLRPPKAGAIVPAVFYTTGPAEVILFDGQPAYTAIPGTQLSYATNSVSYVFSHAATKQVYYLTAGRWFSATSLEGPWTFATPNLPEDFARIPESSPASQVLASVPGTEEAKDAVLMAQIPTSALVDPLAAAQEAKATYDGEPKFAPIEGTSMQYATNTAQKVIKLGEVYYLCLQAVWFTSTTPQGPWQTATSVPNEIYTIPPSSPVYNVTYVTQTATPSGQVEASYTAGYTGAFVIGASVGVVVAGGTGYYYPPYIGYYPGYYGYPPYYMYPHAYGAAAWYNPTTGRYGVSQVAYGPYGAAARGASYNPYTGTATRSAAVATPYGGAFAGRAYNPYTGAYGATRQGSNAYSQWGSSVVSKGGRTAYTQHYTDARGTVGSIQGSQGGAAVGAAGQRGSGFVGRTGGGDVYAGHDGNVYRKTDSGWQKYDKGSWGSVNTPSGQRTSGQTGAQPRTQTATGAQRGSAQGASPQMQSLQSEAMNRQRGAQSSQRFEQRSSAGSFGGGGRSYGGGRGGGRRR